MEILTTIGNITEQTADAIVVNLFEGTTDPSGATDAVDRATGGQIRALISGGDFTGKYKQISLLYPSSGLMAPRIILIGLGKREDFTLERARLAAATASKEAEQRGVKHLATLAHGAGAGGFDLASAAQATVEGSILGIYAFSDYKTDTVPKNRLAKLTLVEFDAARGVALEAGAAAGQHIAEGVCLARDIANAPGNDLPPSVLAQRIAEMAASVGLSCEIFDEHRIASEGMAALLAVGQGSSRPPRFIIMEHKGENPTAAPIVFVGKGITFDTGGISLKAGDGMWDMKFDMCGAAAVVGAMQTVARLHLPTRVIGIVSAAENMPDGKAYRPGDILKPLGGKTVEIRSTDAEGRLALIDALSYISRYKPAAAIDLATLTGACVIALGNDASGLMGNNDALIDAVHRAGNRTGEVAWHLPILEGHRNQIKGDYADLKNSGGRPAGALTAGAFLEAYVDGYPWAHLDIS